MKTNEVVFILDRSGSMEGLEKDKIYYWKYTTGNTEYDINSDIKLKIKGDKNG